MKDLGTCKDGFWGMLMSEPVISIFDGWDAFSHSTASDAVDRCQESPANLAVIQVLVSTQLLGNQ